MVSWAKNVSKVLINFHSNEEGGDHTHLLFAADAISRGLTMHSCSVHISGAHLESTGVVAILESVGATCIAAKSTFNGVYNKIFVWDEGMVLLQSNVRRKTIEPEDGDEEEEADRVLNITINATNKEIFDRMVTAFKAMDKPVKENGGKIYVLTSSGGGLNVQTIGVAASELEVGNYNDDVIRDSKYIIDNLQAKDPNGRIVLLDGPPGTGKTFFTRALLKSIPKASFLLIPSNMVDSLADPSFMDFFIRYKHVLLSPTILLIEDADRCLAPRAADNISVISTLLNMTDGIIGHLLDIRILATTNCKSDEIDSAILRPGRLLKHTHIGSLDNDKAAAVYKRLTGQDATFNKATLAEVYHKAKLTNDNAPDIQLSDVRPRRVGFGA